MTIYYNLYSILSRFHFVHSVYGRDYRKAVIVIVMVIASIPGCKGLSMELYTSDQITIIGTKANAENVEIKYIPILETLYFCPGAKITENEDAILVNFMRCPIKETCKVTHAARLGATENYIVIKHNGKPVFINFKMGRQKIYPK